VEIFCIVFGSPVKALVGETVSSLSQAKNHAYLLDSSKRSILFGYKLCPEISYVLYFMKVLIVVLIPLKTVVLKLELFVNCIENN